jgi:hypothetical protein
VVDSSSLKASPVTGPRGFDGAKKADGVKRHILVDSAGVLVAVVVTPADTQDRAAFPALLRQTKPIAPTIGHVCLDNGYTGQAAHNAAEKAAVSVDGVSGPKPSHRSSSSHSARWSNAPTARSTTTAASTATTKSPPPHTKTS